MKYKFLNEEGKIPPKTVCPFTRICVKAATNNCPHKGIQEPESFSCDIARVFDVMIRNEEHAKRNPDEATTHLD